MPTELPAWFILAFSPARTATYLRAVKGDGAMAERLYWWNIEISGAFYGPLHCLEVTLRNSLHAQLSQYYARTEWWEVAPLDRVSHRCIANARAKCSRMRSGSDADDIVPQLSFGFWVSLLGKKYDRNLWVPTLHRAFPFYSGRRDLLHDNLLSMTFLRNRIMHHEPIHHRDLRADHDKLYRLLGYLRPDAAKQASVLDRVAVVLARRVDVCNGIKAPRF